MVIRLASIIHVYLAEVKVSAVMPNNYLVPLFAQIKGKKEKNNKLLIVMSAFNLGKNKY